MNSVVLRVVGLGPVPAKKNSKMLTRGRLITKPEYQTWMKRCVQSFVSQYYSNTAMDVGGTVTVRSLRSWIASSLPEDDCWTIIPEINVEAIRVPKGQEGAVITIERLK
jgi:hypothetical protein